MIRLLKTLLLFVGAILLGTFVLLPFEILDNYCGVFIGAIAKLAVIFFIFWIIVEPSCQHEYERTGDMLIETGSRKIIYCKCVKCGKTKKNCV